MRTFHPSCALLILLAGCKGESAPPKERTEKETGGPANVSAVGPETSAVAIDLNAGWCSGHGVPESVCARCNESLIGKFKAGGDWCAEHGLPESQCTKCHPEVKEKWEKLKPAPKIPPGDSKEKGGDAGKPGDERLTLGAAADWCDEHGVPNSVCTRCNPDLIAQFRKNGDWCNEHGVPETQCTQCNPDLARRWAELRPRELPRADPEENSGFLLEPNGRLVTGKNDPLCPVDQLRVRLRDRGIVERAGIRTEPAALRRISTVIEAPAEVEFDATRVTRVTPRIGGVALEVIANIGSRAKAGDLLAVIDSPALGEAKSRWIELRETYLLAKADAERTQTIYANARRMLEVCQPGASAEEVLRQTMELVVGDAKSRLLRAHAALELARATEARDRQLAEKKITSEKSLEESRSVLSTAEAEFHASREEIGFAVEKERLAAERGLTIARSALNAAERRLHLLGLDDEEILALGSGPHERLSRYELRSPSEGTVIERHLSAGEAVTEFDTSFVVADLGTLWLTMWSRPEDLPFLQVGQPVVFTVDGLPGRSFEGKLTWISAEVDDKTRSVRVRADLPNENGILRAKMFGHARIAVRDNQEVVSVPVEAVQTDGCCQLLFVRKEDTVFEPRKVELGREAGGFVEVMHGLQVGEAVATAGSFLMKTEILKSSIGAGCCDVKPGR